MRGRYLVLIFLISFAAAAGAGFFAGANYARHHTKTQSAATVANVDAAPSAIATSDTPPVESSVAAAPTDNETTYIVKTLYSIGKEVGVDWPALAAVNELTEKSVLKEGQVLKIPSATQAQTIQSREYKIATTDEEKQVLQSAQDYAAAGTGQLAYRLVPAQVVQRATLLSKFGFTNSDLYIEKNKDLDKGEAIVEVTHLGKLYTIFLNQPLSKGDKGVWTPTKVLY